jgi:hypothetical protein
MFSGMSIRFPERSATPMNAQFRAAVQNRFFGNAWMQRWVAQISVVAFLLVFGSAGAHAAEEIRSFVSDITVEPTGALLVSEAIEIISEGKEVKRGIYRDIPLQAANKKDIFEPSSFEIVSIEHNGEESKYFTQKNVNTLRIYIGDVSVFIPSGAHTYRIVFRMKQQLREFADYTEVYWIAIGEWSFPILYAKAIVRLPQGAKAKHQVAYTGRIGERGRDYSIVGEGSQTVQFAATRRLERGEQLTVVVGFTKGGLPASPVTRSKVLPE